jgi:acetyl-CoA/propionyl-CoA carboxylase biotin carboxyl carrier protein
VPADVVILEHPDFAAGTHSTKWVEDRVDLSGVSAASAAGAAPAPPEGDEEPRVRRDVDVEVDGRRFKVAMWVPEVAGAVAVAAGGPARPRPKAAAGGAGGASGAGRVAVPMQGTIVKVLVAEGDVVEVGQAVCVLEAMKMENHIAAEKAGTVTEVLVTEGQAVGSGDVVVVIGD